MYDLARVKQPGGIKSILDGFESPLHATAKHALMKFGTRQTVTMLARMRALVFLYDVERFFHDCAHLLRAARVLHIENWAHVQTAHRGMGIPGASGAVFLEYACQPIGILRQVFQLHRAVFNKRYRFAVAFHRHHDVQASLAHLPDSRLKFGIEHFDHGTGEAEVCHQLNQLGELADLQVAIFAGKFDQQQRVGFAPDKTIHGGPEHGNLAR